MIIFPKPKSRNTWSTNQNKYLKLGSSQKIRDIWPQLYASKILQSKMHLVIGTFFQDRAYYPLLDYCEGQVVF